MVKTKNLKDSFLWGDDLINMFQWHEWITTPASLVVNIFDDNTSLKSVITQYTLCIDDEVIQVDRVDDLKYYLDLIRKQYDLGGGNHKSFDEKERPLDAVFACIRCHCKPGLLFTVYRQNIG